MPTWDRSGRRRREGAVSKEIPTKKASRAWTKVVGEGVEFRVTHTSPIGMHYEVRERQGEEEGGREGFVMESEEWLHRELWQKLFYARLDAATDKLKGEQR
tara:strand:+ start:1114 stop:1416 length:303 start_codon:yes stop_codon:yes gene_type:complete